jgi:hypothetical protein
MLVVSSLGAAELCSSQRPSPTIPPTLKFGPIALLSPCRKSLFPVLETRQCYIPGWRGVKTFIKPLLAQKKYAAALLYYLRNVFYAADVATNIKPHLGRHIWADSL